MGDTSQRPKRGVSSPSFALMNVREVELRPRDAYLAPRFSSHVSLIHITAIKLIDLHIGLKHVRVVMTVL